MPSEEHHLLFGVVVVQLGMASAEEVLSAAAAWAADPRVAVADRLEASGTLSADQREAVERLVADAVERQGYATKKVLTRPPPAPPEPNASIFESFGGSAAFVPAGMPAPASGDGESRTVTPEATGRYERQDELGRGGIGRVLLAFDRHLGREVALKELIDDGAPGSSVPTDPTSPTVARFLREARVTGLLDHPNIMPVYELGQRDDGTFYYTMRLVRGRTLGDALQDASGLKGRLRLLDRFVDLCQAIAFAHSRGVVHRDIKPDNVMLGAFGETVVLDWGLAKMRGTRDVQGSELRRELDLLLQPEHSRTLAGRALGTPAYMSPEQAEGAMDEIDERSDVWALGAVLFEILTGQAPFDGVTAYEVIGKVMQGEVAKVEAIEGKAPPELVAVVEKAMARAPEHRYQSARQIADEVRAFMAGALVTAYQYSTWEQLRRLASRHRAAAVAGTAVLAALLFALSYGGWAYQRAQRAEERAVVARQRSDLRLAEALARSARRDADERRWTEARIRAARSLSFNPAHEASLRYDRGFAQTHPRGQAIAVDAASILFETDFAPRPRLLARRQVVKARKPTISLSEDEARLFVLSQRRLDVVSTRDLTSYASLRGIVEGPSSYRERHGRLIAATGTTAELLWMEASDPARRRPLGDPVWSVDFALDGSVLIGMNDGLRRVEDLAQGSEPDELLIPTASAVKSLAVGADGRVAVWVQQGQILLGIDEALKTEDHREAAPYLRFTDDGKHLIAWQESSPFRVFDTETLEDRTPATIRGRKLNGAALSPDGRTALLGLTGPEEDVLVDLVHLSVRKSTVPGSWGARALDGRMAVSALRGIELAIWDHHSDEIRARLRGHTNVIWGLALLEARSDRPHTLISVDWNGRAAVWALSPARQGPLLQVEGLQALSRFGEGGIAAGTLTGARAWNKNFELIGALERPSRVHALAPKGKELLLNEVGTGLLSWDPTARRLLHLQDGRFGSVATSPGGQVVFTNLNKLSQLLDGTVQETELAAEDRIHLSPSGRYLAMSRGPVAEIRSLPALSMVTSFKQPATISDVALSPDDRTLLTVDVAGGVRAYDLANHTERWADQQSMWVNQVSFSSDGQLCATAADDSRVVVYRVADGQRLLRLRAADGTMDALFLDGERLAYPASGGLAIRKLDFSYLKLDPEALTQAALAESTLVVDGMDLIAQWDD